MEVPQKFIQMACNKICNKFGTKKNKNKHKKISTTECYAEFLKTRGNGHYSKGIIEVCNKLLAYEIMFSTDKGKDELKRKAALQVTERFLNDLNGIDPAFLSDGLGNLPAVINLKFQGEWKPELLKIDQEAYHR